MKSIYRDPNWYKLQEVKEDGVEQKYFYANEFGNVDYKFIKRYAGEVNGKKYYDIVTARGFGGPYVNCSDSVTEEFVRVYERDFDTYCKENHIICEYVKFDPWVHNEKYLEEYYNIEMHGKQFCNKLREDFFNRQYSSNTRRKVRISIKMGVTVEIDEKGDSILDFLKMYNNMVNKNNVSNYYILDDTFIKNYFQELPGKVFIANAKLDGKTIASNMVLLGEDIAHFHFGGKDPEYNSVFANEILMYKCSCYAKERGKKIYDLGGAGKDNKLAEFKGHFVKEDDCYLQYVGKRILNKNIYNILVSKKIAPNSNFFPEYR